MLELLNQLDGFSSDERIKVQIVQFLSFQFTMRITFLFLQFYLFYDSAFTLNIQLNDLVILIWYLKLYFCIQVIAATNRADILDPALMRSGRLDRKIEFPHPTEEARARILQVDALVRT